MAVKTKQEHYKQQTDYRQLELFKEKRKMDLFDNYLFSHVKLTPYQQERGVMI